MLIPRGDSKTPEHRPDEFYPGLVRRPRHELPYPDEGAVYTAFVESPAPLGWEGRGIRALRHTLSGTRRYEVRKTERVTHMYECALASDRKPRDGNMLMSETVHAADKMLKEYLLVNNPEWGGCLRDTQSDEHGLDRPELDMFIDIDNVICANNDNTESYKEPAGKSYTFSLDRPRLADWGGRTRCVYVERVTVSEVDDRILGQVVRELRVTVRDDTFSVDMEHREMPYLNVPLAGFVRMCANPEPLKASTVEEKVAMEALRESLTENEWRRYLTRGFILVRGSSGKRYQIFRDKWHTKVWDKGKVVSEICARISGAVPPTDNVIAFKTMIEADERQFERIGNVYKMAAA